LKGHSVTYLEIITKAIANACSLSKQQEKHFRRHMLRGIEEGLSPGRLLQKVPKEEAEILLPKLYAEAPGILRWVMDGIKNRNQTP
jgi:hypothetical protein